MKNITYQTSKPVLRKIFTMHWAMSGPVLHIVKMVGELLKHKPGSLQ